MNWPNRLSIFRLILVPIIITLMIIGHYLTGNQFFIITGNYHLPIFTLVSGILFIIASLTDFVDGYLARKFNQITNLGKFLDPIADKFLVNATLILFAWNGMVPVWVTLIFILRDIFIDFTRMILASKGTTLAAGWLGKWKTIWQMIGLSILFFVSYEFFNQFEGKEYGWYNQLILIPVYLGAFFSIYSGIDYFAKSKTAIFALATNKKGKN